MALIHCHPSLAMRLAMRLECTSALYQPNGLLPRPDEPKELPKPALLEAPRPEEPNELPKPDKLADVPRPDALDPPNPAKELPFLLSPRSLSSFSSAPV